MKMIRAIVRPEKVEEVVDSLADGGFVALTKLDVFGRGKQKGERGFGYFTKRVNA